MNLEEMFKYKTDQRYDYYCIVVQFMEFPYDVMYTRITEIVKENLKEN